MRKPNILVCGPARSSSQFLIQRVVKPGSYQDDGIYRKDRVLEELAHWEESTGEKYAFTSYQNFSQELVQDETKTYDYLSVQIEIVPQADWDELEKDWEAHDGYRNDRNDRRKHEKWQDSKTIRFTEHFWFNINDFFSFGKDEDPDAPENDE